MAISSSVSRQSTAKPGQITAISRTPRVGMAVSTDFVSGLSHCAGPKRDWKLTLHSRSRSSSSSASNRAVVWQRL